MKFTIEIPDALVNIYNKMIENYGADEIKAEGYSEYQVIAEFSKMNPKGITARIGVQILPDSVGTIIEVYDRYGNLLAVDNSHENLDSDYWLTGDRGEVYEIRVRGANGNRLAEDEIEPHTESEDDMDEEEEEEDSSPYPDEDEDDEENPDYAMNW